MRPELWAINVASLSNLRFTSFCRMDFRTYPRSLTSYPVSANFFHTATMIACGNDLGSRQNLCGSYGCEDTARYHNLIRRYRTSIARHYSHIAPTSRPHRTPMSADPASEVHMSDDSLRVNAPFFRNYTAFIQYIGGRFRRQRLAQFLATLTKENLFSNS